MGFQVPVSQLVSRISGCHQRYLPVWALGRNSSNKPPQESLTINIFTRPLLWGGFSLFFKEGLLGFQANMYTFFFLKIEYVCTYVCICAMYGIRYTYVVSNYQIEYSKNTAWRTKWYWLNQWMLFYLRIDFAFATRNRLWWVDRTEDPAPNWTPIRGLKSRDHRGLLTITSMFPQ